VAAGLQEKKRGACWAGWARFEEEKKQPRAGFEVRKYFLFQIFYKM
jgi:hypothetical protein